MNTTDHFESAVHALQERITDAFLGTLAKLSPLKAEEFGTLTRSVLPHKMGDRLVCALLEAGWITSTRDGEPIDPTVTQPQNGDLVILTTSTPSAAALREALKP